ncbi:MAG: hypothetical protein F6K19_28925, partial [Cyanothece sp. SIO1E1]|nr:hypothetical protein [Cyanothece sp. SIO1E1]
MTWRWTPFRSAIAAVLVLMLCLGMGGCGDRAPVQEQPDVSASISSRTPRKIAEASPPEAIQALKPILETYQPQVRIVRPRQNEVIKDTTVSVRFYVQDLPIFKHPDL